MAPTKANRDQLSLFGDAQPPATRSRDGARTVAPAAVDADLEIAVAALPAGVRLGTSSWSFPGWTRIVYAGEHSESTLARGGLAAYARHPLLGCVGIDRTYYRPVDAETFRVYASAVPEDFRFVVKAHEDLVLPRFSNHPRYGERRGRNNPRYLDATYAIDAVVAPALEGLGAMLGPIVFQFSPQRTQGDDDGKSFAEALERFLDSLPSGPLYAVELRTKPHLCPEYADTLARTGAVHCLNVHPSMPSISEQWARIAVESGPALLVRWMLGAGLEYEEARDRYAPFDRLVDENPATRSEVADTVIAAAMKGIPVYVVANNKAEGSAPLTVFALAREIAGRR